MYTRQEEKYQFDLTCQTWGVCNNDLMGLRLSIAIICVESQHQPQAESWLLFFCIICIKIAATIVWLIFFGVSIISFLCQYLQIYPILLTFAQTYPNTKHMIIMRWLLIIFATVFVSCQQTGRIHGYGYEHTCQRGVTRSDARHKIITEYEKN